MINIFFSERFQTGFWFKPPPHPSGNSNYQMNMVITFLKKHWAFEAPFPSLLEFSLKGMDIFFLEPHILSLCLHSSMPNQVEFRFNKMWISTEKYTQSEMFSVSTHSIPPLTVSQLLISV